MAQRAVGERTHLARIALVLALVARQEIGAEWGQDRFNTKRMATFGVRNEMLRSFLGNENTFVLSDSENQCFSDCGNLADTSALTTHAH